MAATTVKITSLRGVTINVTIVRSLRIRVWLAVQLIRFAAWMCGMGVRVHETDEEP